MQVGGKMSEQLTHGQTQRRNGNGSEKTYINDGPTFSRSINSNNFHAFFM